MIYIYKQIVIFYGRALRSLKAIGSLLLMIFLFLTCCQYPYTAKIDDETGILVVDGALVKESAVQEIRLSRSTTLYFPELEPVIDCDVSVLDDEGREYNFMHSTNGLYLASIPEEDLEYGKAYMLRIVTAEGDVYESDYETIYQAAPVDSIYFFREDKVAEYNMVDEGIQFYIDLKGSEGDSRYYRWKLEETYEYHAAAPTDYYYINELLEKYYLPSFKDIFFCWKTTDLEGMYSSSTINLTSNEKKMIPLNYVYEKSQKLNVKYSILVKQYSLTREAFDYWNQAKIETRETGGLYTQQPGQVQSNIRCVTNENLEALGYFWASSLSTKRIFVSAKSDLIYPDPNCQVKLVEDQRDFDLWPAYIMTDGFGNEFSASPRCMNCLLKGGYNTMPEYWEDESITVLKSE